MKALKKTAIAAAVLSSFAISTQASAELEANIGATSNYIWRGVTQTSDQAAIQGGLDFSSGGLYLGTWASNVDWETAFNDPGATGYELDFYGGYGGEVGAFGYDVGYIYYAYPSMEDSDFSEVYFNGSISMFNFGVAYQVDADFTDENYLYVSAGVDLELTPDYGLSLYVGDYDFEDDGDGYTHYGASLSKGDFALAIDKNDIDGTVGQPDETIDDPRVSVSWSKTF